MLLYQLQDRVLRIPEGTRVEFPNEVEVTVTLGPPQEFGAAVGRTRNPIAGRSNTIHWNANTGRVEHECNPPLEPLQARTDYSKGRFELTGNRACWKSYCTDLGELQGILTSLRYVFPVILNLYLGAPAFVDNVSGRVGGVAFRWEHSGFWSVGKAAGREMLELGVVASFERLGMFEGTKNRRLVAALHYFHMACRLGAAGVGPWEFMAECVLNYAKALHVLFGAKTDDVRRELGKLGYSENEVEQDFVPLLTLRSQFDVAHPRLAVLEQAEVEVLYRYLAQSESDFRTLLLRVVEYRASGRYALRDGGDIRLDGGEQRRLDRLVAICKTKVMRTVAD